MKEYLAGIRNSFRFSGRTTRREFWMFYLVNLILSCLIPFLTGMIIGFVGGTSDAAIAVTYLYLLFMLLPAVSISVRRLHDIGRTGWWVAFGLLPVLARSCFSSSSLRGGCAWKTSTP